jgi:hypothetical protein
MISVNATLETFNNLGFMTVPTLTDELSAVSDRFDAVNEKVDSGDFLHNSESLMRSIAEQTALNDQELKQRLNQYV